ncbi:MAG: general secretion pathway protein E [Lentimonas sp.]|jgi:general secretion pathway protein E
MDALAIFRPELPTEACELIEQAPRGERLQKLAEALKITESDALQRIADANELPLIQTVEAVSEDLPELPVRMLTEYSCLPLKVAADTQTLEMVTTWPPDALMSEWIYALSGYTTRWSLCSARKVLDAITQSYGVGSGSLERSDIDAGEQNPDEEEDEDAAIIRFVNEVIRQAMVDRATDIHFEPQKKDLTLRYRIDGYLIPVQVPENLIHFQAAIIARLKIMARLNISERRRPQDGRISFKAGKEPLDIRISTLPTMFGESVSLRLLNQETSAVTIESLGMSAEIQQVVEPVLERPHGIILVTGPTGSGKSTTLNAFMRKIRSPARRIVTIEDPVEYEVQGINQTQINTDIGLTFAQALRHVLRQDPDVIMVGEIRDAETASIAIRASLTGHLVFSTLHTNDAAGALARLIDMEIEPFLIASSVELVIAQRLVRRLCQECKQESPANPALLQRCLTALEIPQSACAIPPTLYQPCGCESCQKTGYKGRIGLFEALRIKDELNAMIIERKSTRAIRDHAVELGMQTLQECGWQHVCNGDTSLPEIMRFAEEVRKGKASDKI